MKTILVVSLFFVWSLTVPVWGQQNFKVGYIDIQAAISESQAGKAAKENFQAEVKKIEAGLLKEKEELERLKTSIDRKGLLLKEEERKNLEREFQRRYRNYQRTMQDHQQDLREREKEMTAKILNELQEITVTLGQTENYTLILSRDEVLYANPGADLTGKVVQLYDQRFTSPAAKAE